jgi:hypothetical protein
VRLGLVAVVFAFALLTLTAVGVRWLLEYRWYEPCGHRPGDSCVTYVHPPGMTAAAVVLAVLGAGAAAGLGGGAVERWRRHVPG